MKNLLLTSSLIGLIFGSSVLISASADAASVSKINGVDGAEMCKEQIENSSDYDGIRFQRESAASFRGSNFPYWINASSMMDAQSGPLRYRCEISRTGEVREIFEESGRWSI